MGFAIVAAGVVLALLAAPAQGQGTAQLVGKEQCQAGDRPEPGLQGQVPVPERNSGAAAAGYWCNLTEVGAHGSLAADASHERLTGWANFDTYKHCAYFHDGNDGNPGGGGTIVMDVSDPAKPKQTAYLTTAAMQGAWESLRVNAARGLLVADHQPSSGGNDAPGTSPFDVYDVSQDCAHPRLLFSGVLPNAVGHEGWFQPDGMVYYVSGLNALVPVDLSDPAKPRELAVFDEPAHGGSTSDDGTRGYHCTGSSVTIYDTSEIAARKANPKLTEISQVQLPATNGCQETYPVTYGNKKYLIQFGEVGEFAPPPFGKPCGQIQYANFSRPNIIDITDERNPKLLTTLMNEVALPSNCPAVAGDSSPNSNRNATFVSVLFLYGTHMCHPDRLHEPTILACAEFYSGVRVYDIRDPMAVKEIAYFNAGSLSPTDPTLDQAPARPVIRPDLGQIWVNTQSEGFHVLKFAAGVYPFPDAQRCPSGWDWFVVHYNLACAGVTPSGPAAPAPRCATRLRVTARAIVGRHRARRLARAVVYVDGRRHVRLRGARVRKRLTLRGLRGDTVTVRLVGRTRQGRVIRGTRTFRLCA